MKPITDEYAAGLFDGEGCAAIFKRPHEEYYSYGVAIGSTNHQIVMDMRETYGGLVTKPYTPRGNAKPSVQWILRGPGTIKFLLRVRPWLRIKAKQADNVIDWSRKMKWEGRYEPVLGAGGRRRTKTATEIDFYHHSVARTLNKRGLV